MRTKSLIIDSIVRNRQTVGVGFAMLIACALYVLVNSKSTSPIVYTRTLDSQIFQYMGFILAHGKIPYTDFFDHKGLLLYSINMLGIELSPLWGVCTLQVLNLFATCCVWYRMSFQLENVLLRLLMVIVALLCLYPYYTYGNLTEEWSLFFISIPLMFYYRRITLGNGELSPNELLLSGLCIGLICLIRINNSAPIMGCIIYAAYMAILKKKWCYISRAFCLLSVGILIPILLTLAYMYLVGGKQGFNDFIFANWTFNLEYSGKGQMTWDIERLKFLYKVLIPGICILPFLKYKKDYVLPVSISYVITLMTIGKTQHLHYLMVFVPLIVVSFICLPKKLLFVLITLLAVLNMKTYIREFRSNDFYYNIEKDASAVKNLISKVENVENKSIWNYNGAFILGECVKSGLVQCNRMFLPWQMNTSKELMESEKNRICRVKPDYVLYPKYVENWMNESANYKYSNLDIDYIQKEYKVVSSVQLNDGTSISLMQRK